MRIPMMIVAGAAALTAATSANAAQVADGTLSSVALFNPTISLASDPSTYSALNGSAFVVSGTGGFASLGSTLGRLNGTLSFAQSVGTVVEGTVANFFTFNDLQGGTYNFSTTSVQTNSFVNTSAFTSGSLYVLGNLVNANLGFSATPASLSIQFNNTGGSAYSSALSLAVPPAISAVPETGTWAMMLLGVGLVGGLMRRKQKVSTRVTFA